MSISVMNQANWEKVTDVGDLQKIVNPSMGPRHQPVNHGEALRIFLTEAVRKGLKLLHPQGLLSPCTKKYVYVTEVENGELDDRRFALGFVNFNDRSKSLQSLTGEKVFVCSNEMFTTDTIDEVRTRHSTNIGSRLVEKIRNIVERFGAFQEERVLELEMLRSVIFGDEIAGQLLLRMHRETAMSNTDVFRVFDEFETPTFGEFERRDGQNFINAVTHILKGTENPLRRMEITRSVKDIIVSEAKMLAA